MAPDDDMEEANDPHEADYASQLNWHLERGTRPNGKRAPWAPEEFARTVGRSSGSTVRNWCRAANLPFKNERIEYALFGDDPRRDSNSYARWRRAFREAYADANTLRQRAKRQSNLPSAVTEAGPGQSSAIQAIDLVTNLSGRLPANFVGREGPLVSIAELIGNRPVAIVGIKGVGKTVTAKAYADRYRDLYSVIWWIDASTRETASTDLFELGLKLNWVTPLDTSPVDMVLSKLWIRGSGFLLIYDGAIDEEKISTLLPNGQAHLLITSNTLGWRAAAMPIKLEVWPPDVGAGFLIARTGYENEYASAERLSQRLGGLPLAHEQAAAYCDRLGTSFDDYVMRFDAAPIRMLEDENYVSFSYYNKRSVAKTLSLAIIEAIAECSFSKILILGVASMSAAPVPHFIFSGAKSYHEKPLLCFIEPANLELAISILRNLSLIEVEKIVDPEYGGYISLLSLHPLVREVVLEMYLDKQSLQRALFRAVVAACPYGMFQIGRNRQKLIYPHAMFLLSQGIPRGCKLHAVIILARFANIYLRLTFQIEKAISHLYRAMSIVDSTQSLKMTIAAADVKQSLAQMLHLSYKKGDSINRIKLLAEESIAIRERLKSAYALELCPSLVLLGMIHKFRRNKETAKKYFDRVEYIQSSVL